MKVPEIEREHLPRPPRLGESWSLDHEEMEDFVENPGGQEPQKKYSDPEALREQAVVLGSATIQELRAMLRAAQSKSSKNARETGSENAFISLGEWRMATGILEWLDSLTEDAADA